MQLTLIDHPRDHLKIFEIIPILSLMAMQITIHFHFHLLLKGNLYLLNKPHNRQDIFLDQVDREVFHLCTVRYE